MAWVVVFVAGSGCLAYMLQPEFPGLFSISALHWASAVFAVLWGGIVAVLLRLADLPADQALSPEDMRRVRPIAAVGIKKLWIVAALGLICALLFFALTELRKDATITQSDAFIFGALFGIGAFYFVQVPGWLKEMREFRWQVAEREALRRRKQDTLRKLTGEYEPDPRFDKPLLKRGRLT
jgi:hypothetical protein